MSFYKQDSVTTLSSVLCIERDFGDVQKVMTSFARSEPMPFLPMEYVGIKCILKVLTLKII
jgi:hypothetical protein